MKLFPTLAIICIAIPALIGIIVVARDGLVNLLGFDDVKSADWEGDDDTSHH